jgi:Skp family chaperone for outer membrane proteins
MPLAIGLSFILSGCKFGSSEQDRRAQLEYQRTVEYTLNELDQKIATLQAQADTVAEATRAEFRAMLSDLQEKKTQARAQLARLKASSANTWQDLRTDINEAVEELQATYDRSVARFQ